MNPFANLQQWNHSGNTMNALMQGMEAGSAMRQQREARERQAAVDNAFRGMMGGDPNAVNALSQIPGMAGDAYKISEAQREQQVRADVAAGRADPTALAAINWDDYSELTKTQAEIAKQNVETIGQLALMADTPEKWDATVRQLGPEFQKYIGQFALRESVIARAGQAKQFLEQQEPKYMAVPNDADLVNVKDPNALKAFGEQRAAVPQAGQIEDGYRFKGGDPADPNAWEKVGDAGGNASGGFQG